MPYSSLAKSRIKKVGGVHITLAQANSIAKMADAIDGDNAWPIAISHFKDTHKIRLRKWVSKERKESSLFVQKEDNRYRIIGISTVAIADREDETFGVEAIDYEVERAKETGRYPEFRMFHKKALAIGRVDKMKRVGIFAVDEGYSYEDPFSLEACEIVSKDTSGKWHMSRGFFVIEAKGGCPSCGEVLLVRQKHMLMGFRCPTCGSVHLKFKGVLKEMHFRKTRTFDNTITDIPCVPFTGVTAIKSSEEFSMNKAQLRKKLLKAGFDEETVDDRLDGISPERLKEFDDIPEAKIYKELELDDDDLPGDDDLDDDDYFDVDDEVLKEISLVVKEVVAEELGGVVKVITSAVTKALEGISVDVNGFDDMEIDMKEVPEIVAIKEQLEAIKEIVDELAESDDKRLKELLGNTPRRSKLRIKRSKSEDLDDDDDEDEDVDDEGVRTKTFQDYHNSAQQNNDVIVGGDGRQAESMTEFIQGD